MVELVRNMAYIKGLWFANGCIFLGDIFEIEMPKKDEYILRKIAKEIKYEGPVVDCINQQVVRIMFKNAAICNAFLRCEPFDVPKEFLSDFIRGYFDGKGRFTRVKKNRINCAFSGKRNFLLQLWGVLQEEAGVKGGSCNEEILKFGTTDSIRIYNYMYKNNPELFLKRKRENL